MESALMRRRLAAPCGACCGECAPIREGTCVGCAYSLGATPRGECTVFQCCVLERGQEHCGMCLDFPCQTFLSHAPAPVVGRRYRALTERAQMGTAAWVEAAMPQDRDSESVDKE